MESGDEFSGKAAFACSPISVPMNLKQNGCPAKRDQGPFLFFCGSKSSRAGGGLQLSECRRPQPCSVAARCQRNLAAPASTTCKSQLKHEDESEKIDIGLCSLSVECCFFCQIETF